MCKKIYSTKIEKSDKIRLSFQSQFIWSAEFWNHSTLTKVKMGFCPYTTWCAPIRCFHYYNNYILAIFYKRQLEIQKRFQQIH